MTERSRLRLAVLRVLVLSLVATLGGRLWFLQVLSADHYQAAAAANTARTVVTQATRGLVLDDRGRPWLGDRTSVVVTVDRARLPRRAGDRQAVLAHLARLLGSTGADLERRVTPCGARVPRPCWNGSPYQPVPVAEDVTPAVQLGVTEHQEDFPGVLAELSAVRDYPQGQTAAQTLGYLSPVTAAELAAHPDRQPSDLVGRSGVEQVYDADLRGHAGTRRLAVDARSVVTATLTDTPPTRGNDVVLSLDRDVQRAVEDSLVAAVQSARAAGHPTPGAAGVVLDARTGHVVALASVPTYDPSLFVGGIAQADYDRLAGDTVAKPLLNRAVQEVYPPGSTFKAISGAAVLADGQATGDARYACPPSVRIGGRSFRNFEGESTGALTLHGALVVSCDTVFYGFGYDAWQADEARLGAHQPAQEPVASMARAFGLGAPTGVDLPDEAAGTLSSRELFQRRWQQTRDQYCAGAKDPTHDAQRRIDDQAFCDAGEVYRGGDAVNAVIGQGDTAVTPLQLAVAYAALVNGGTVFSPRLARAVVDPAGVVRTVDAPVVRHLPVPPDALRYLTDSLVGVVTEARGTAAGAFAGFPFDRVTVGGKTGTAEVGPAGSAVEDSWFASFAGPAGQPAQYVAAVVVPQSGQGAQFAAPAVRRIWDAVFGNGTAPALPGGVEPAALPRVGTDGRVAAPR